MSRNWLDAVMWRSTSKVPANGTKLSVKIKMSKWQSPGKRTKFKCHDKLSNVDGLEGCKLCHITDDAMASAGLNCCSTVCQHKCI